MEWTKLTQDEIKWILVDFDNTIATNSGYPDYIPNGLVNGTKEALDKINNLGYKVTIFTARPWVDYANIERFCEHYELPVKRIICGKPLARCLIDDLNVAFDGDWDKAIDNMKKF